MMITKNIISIGVEVECGINSKHWRKVKAAFPNAVMDSDLSVRMSDFDYSDAEILFHTSDLEKMKNFIEMIFSDPEQMEQDSGCGNHVHIRFKNMDKAVALFSFRGARELFKVSYEAYARVQRNSQKYLSRMENGYCKTDYPENQTITQLKDNSKSGARYTAFNLNSFNTHDTVEFRILPFVESAEEYIRNLDWLLKIAEKIYGMNFPVVNKTIRTKKPPEIKDEFVIEIPDKKIFLKMIGRTGRSLVQNFMMHKNVFQREKHIGRGNDNV